MQEKEKKSIDRFGTVLLAGKILLSSGAEIYRGKRPCIDLRRQCI